eukprot:5194788-Karenia_brevis.AAC.1
MYHVSLNNTPPETVHGVHGFPLMYNLAGLPEFKVQYRPSHLPGNSITAAIALAGHSIQQLIRLCPHHL